MIRSFLALLIFLLLFAGNSSAEKVYLKSGKVIEGEITEKEEQYIKINYNGVNLTYWLDEIERIGNQNSPSEVGISELISSDSSEKFYYDKERNLKIAIPTGWVVIDKSNPKELAKEVSSNVTGIICLFKQDFNLNTPLIVVSINFPSQEYNTIENYAVVLKERNLDRQRNSPGMEIIENAEVINLGNNKCIKTVIKLNNDVNVYYNFLDGKIVYSVSGNSLASEFEDYKDLFEKIAATLQFENAKINSEDIIVEANRLGNEGLSLIKQGKAEEGLDLLRRAKQIDAQNPDWHMNYGSLLFVKGGKIFQSGNKQEAEPIFKEAEQELLTAVQLFGDSYGQLKSHCLFLIGDIHYYIYGDKTGAKSYYEKSLNLYPGHAEANAALNKIANE